MRERKTGQATFPPFHGQSTLPSESHMTRRTLLNLVVPALLATACHHPDAATPASVRAEQRDPTPARMAPADAVRQDGPQAPALARFVLVEQTASRLRLRAEVLKQAPFSVPLTVQVQVPSTLRLEQGPATWELPADAQPGTYSQELAFHVDAVPSEPIRVTAHAEGAGFGVHATDAFRVPGGAKSGSRDTQDGVPMPRPTGPAVKVGNTDFGPSIPAN